MRATTACLLVATFCSISAAFEKRFAGRWANEDPANGSVTKAEIRTGSGEIKVRLWGNCRPVDCDWGEAKAELNDNVLRVVWKSSFATRMQELTLDGASRLRIVTATTFTDNSERPNYTVTDFLKKN
jgi:hypothetical protein